MKTNNLRFRTGHMALIGQQMATCVTHTPHDHVTYHYWYYGRRRPEQGFPASNRARSLIGMVTLFEPTQGPNMHGDRTCVQGCKEYGGHHRKPEPFIADRPQPVLDLSLTFLLRASFSPNARLPRTQDGPYCRGWRFDRQRCGHKLHVRLMLSH